MRDRPPLRRAIAVVGLASLGLPILTAAASAEDGRWHFRLAPYLWLPQADISVDTTITGLPNTSGDTSQAIGVNVDTNPSDYLDNLKMAAMLIGEARKDRWSVFTDFIYVDFGDEKSDVRSITDPNGAFTLDRTRKADTALSTTVWTLAGGYTVAESRSANLDLFGGFRYLSMDSSLKLTLEDSSGRRYRSRSKSLDQQAWDGIVGARGRLSLNERWFVPYYADIGTGDSSWTWQAMLGLGYHFKWGDTVLVVRSLSYSFDDNDVDLRMTGPGLGVAFEW